MKTVAVGAESFRLTTRVQGRTPRSDPPGQVSGLPKRLPLLYLLSIIYTTVLHPWVGQRVRGCPGALDAQRHLTKVWVMRLVGEGPGAAGTPGARVGSGRGTFFPHMANGASWLGPGAHSDTCSFLPGASSAAKPHPPLHRHLSPRADAPGAQRLGQGQRPRGSPAHASVPPSTPQAAGARSGGGALWAMRPFLLEHVAQTCSGKQGVLEASQEWITAGN